jgi:hypothetical protein
MDIEALRQGVLGFVRSCECPEGPGRYRYSPSSRRPTLYASTYAARIFSLFDAWPGVDASAREAWIAYLNAHQDEDGLYRDPVIAGEGWYKDDPLWCGRAHLTGQVIGALAALGGVAARPFSFLDPYRDPDRLERWLEERDWGARVAFTGNEVCNIGRLLQYARDFHHDAAAGRAAAFLLDWLAGHRFNPATGLWGAGDVRDPVALSHAIQGAYHWWILFFYDGYPMPAPERTIDSLLRSQNPEGGFGWGVHNAEHPYRSSACEDIDSSHPLAQLYGTHDYRRDAVRRALERAAEWILRNRMADGGFVFVLDRAYAYGHPELSSEKSRSGLFPTWFRLLNLALIGKALPTHPLGGHPWRFDRCPGPQVWNEPEI